MKRSSSSAQENYEHVLMCLICRSLFDDYDHQPKFLPCHHTFCKECLGEYVRQIGDEVECPSCRSIASIPVAGVTALQTNFYVKYIQALVNGKDGCRDSSMQCEIHDQQTLSSYCTQCQSAVCKTCLKNPDSLGSCDHNTTKSLTSITEELHLLLDSTFSISSTTLEKKKASLKTLLKELSDEKDVALKQIDSCFEQHVHTVHRRATLLKNNVIHIFSENVARIEGDMMEIATALTCIVSLKEDLENRISRGDFKDFKRGVTEISEVKENIEEKIKLDQNHINFENSHGSDKFQMSVKDLGRVKCVRSHVPEEDSASKPDSQNAQVDSNLKTKEAGAEEREAGTDSKAPDPASVREPSPSYPYPQEITTLSSTPANDQPKRRPLINPNITKPKPSRHKLPSNAPKKSPVGTKSPAGMNKNLKAKSAPGTPQRSKGNVDGLAKQTAGKTKQTAGKNLMNPKSKTTLKKSS